MIILAINCGSSSLRFKLYNSKKWQLLAIGCLDGLGIETSAIKFQNKITNEIKEEKKLIKNHEEAFKLGLELLEKNNVLKSIDQIDCVVHRVVHGGDELFKPLFLDKKIIKKIEELTALAPLHNPHNLVGIRGAKKLLKKAKNIAVFDTAFHHTLGEKAYLYALKNSFLKKYKIRRYGFHGISHEYVSKIAANLFPKKNLKIISCHIGNGVSITAIKNGKSIDTSMGFTPTEGVPMGTRSGDIDPLLCSYLIKNHNFSAEKIADILNNESGIKAISELSRDVRIIWAEAQKKNKKAILALEILAYKIAKYIGAYCASLNGLDILIFTAGIGENAWYIREMVGNYLTFLGLKIDPKKNIATVNKEKPTIISGKKSKIKVIVIPTNEELLMAEEAYSLLKNR